MRAEKKMGGVYAIRVVAFVTNNLIVIDWPDEKNECGPMGCERLFPDREFPIRWPPSLRFAAALVGIASSSPQPASTIGLRRDLFEKPILVRTTLHL